MTLRLGVRFPGVLSKITSPTLHSHQQTINRKEYFYHHKSKRWKPVTKDEVSNKPTKSRANVDEKKELKVPNIRRKFRRKTLFISTNFIRVANSIYSIRELARMTTRAHDYFLIMNWPLINH